MLYTRDQLLEEGLFDLPQIREYRPRLAEINDLQRAHIGVPSIARLITPAHLTSAGGCLVAADAVMSGEVKRAFALVRPPGHHAMRVVHGIRGFCTVNIEAVMVEYLRSVYGIRKIAVVDTDVHHGDGSQDIFYHDPDTYIFLSYCGVAQCPPFTILLMGIWIKTKIGLFGSSVFAAASCSFKNSILFSLYVPSASVSLLSASSSSPFSSFELEMEIKL